VIRIYSLNKIIILVLFYSLSAIADEDVISFCFEKDVRLDQVEAHIEFLKTGADKIQVRTEDNCLDVYTTSSRSPLYDKLITKKFKIISNAVALEGELKDACRVQLIERKYKKNNEKILVAGSKNKINSKSEMEESTIKTELLLTSGKTGNIRVQEKDFSVECLKTLGEVFQLSFYLGEKTKTNIKSEVTIKKGELIDIGNITNELISKQNTIGIPQTVIADQEMNEKIIYELKVL
jgi:hypothetical protein